MQIFPAIDLKDKQVVRLTQGDYGKVEVYGQDPAAAARGFAAQGAKYLHVVDLDGAKDGALSNFDAVSAIIAATGMFVEVGGGIRDEARVRAYLEQGSWAPPHCAILRFCSAWWTNTEKKSPWAWTRRTVLWPPTAG